jgi:NDP-sugar pyrophosphorylase family protein
MVFSTQDFFDLQSYSHRALFANTTFVWEALKRLKSYLAGLSLGKIEVEIPLGAFLINPESISIGKGSVVEPGAYIKGPCVIGERCSIRQGAYIRGDLVTGNDCVIGHTTELKHAIFLDGVHAAHFAYVGDSILGQRVNLGAGTKCANLRLDGQEVIVHHEGRRYATGMRKFGAILGDGAQTGCNAVTNPGTLFGPGVLCYPCLNVGGVILSGVVKAPMVPRES